MKVYQKLARELDRMERGQNQSEKIWVSLAATEMESVMQSAPSGSGIDNGTVLLKDSTSEKLIFQVSFHHMNEVGYYDGWTEHTATVKPSLAYGFTLRLSGSNRNGIKEYLEEIYQEWLDSEV
jgi:hypothetical protein